MENSHGEAINKEAEKFFKQLLVYIPEEDRHEAKRIYGNILWKVLNVTDENVRKKNIDDVKAIENLRDIINDLNGGAYVYFTDEIANDAVILILAEQRNGLLPMALSLLIERLADVWIASSLENTHSNMGNENYEKTIFNKLTFKPKVDFLRHLKKGNTNHYVDEIFDKITDLMDLSADIRNLFAQTQAQVENWRNVGNTDKAEYFSKIREYIEKFYIDYEKAGNNYKRFKSENGKCIEDTVDELGSLIKNLKRGVSYKGQDFEELAKVAESISNVRAFAEKIMSEIVHAITDTIMEESKRRKNISPSLLMKMEVPTIKYNMDVDEILYLIEKSMSERPIFHSEADLQHSLAWYIHEHLHGANVRPEKPFNIGEKGKRIYLDILIDNGGKKTGIELKYKTEKFAGKFNDEMFELKSHSAQDLGMFDFMKDIERLETLVEEKQIDRGFAVLLTNDKFYWEPKNPRFSKLGNDNRPLYWNFRTFGDKSIGEEFRKLRKGTLKWNSKNGEPPKGAGSNRSPIEIKGNYNLIWKSLNKGNIKFKFLLVEVK